MENKVNYAIVGTFVISLSIAAIFIIIWLSAGFTSQDDTIYKVYMTEAVSGLSLESPVEFNGVLVGTVTDIKLDVKNPHVVILLLKIKSSTPVTQGTRATLNIRGVTGNAFVALTDKGENTKPLAVNFKEQYPVITTSPSLLFRLDSALNNLVTDLHGVSRSVQTLLNPTNQMNIRKMLFNLEKITHNFSNNDRFVSTIFENSARASQELPSLFQSGNRTFYNLEKTSNNISSLSNELKSNPSVLLRGRESVKLGPGEK